MKIIVLAFSLFMMGPFYSKPASAQVGLVKYCAKYADDVLKWISGGFKPLRCTVSTATAASSYIARLSPNVLKTKVLTAIGHADQYFFNVTLIKGSNGVHKIEITGDAIWNFLSPGQVKLIVEKFGVKLGLNNTKVRSFGELSHGTYYADRFEIIGEITESTWNILRML